MRWHECKDQVRFCEVDSFNVMWHGHFIKYFEIGRLELSRQFSLSPGEMKELGFYAPVIDLRCRFRKPARYGDAVIIRTVAEPTEKASLIFRYELVRASDGALIAEGHSTHALLTLEGKMMYSLPERLKQPLEEMLAYCHG